MRVLRLFVAAIASATAFVNAFPYTLTNESFLYESPSSIDKRALWNVADLSSGDRKQITTALSDTIDVVKVILGFKPGMKGMMDDKHAGKMSQWFGNMYDNNMYKLQVRQVFLNMYNPKEVGNDAAYGTTRVSKIKVWNDDYWVPEKTNVESSVNADGKTPFCQLKASGGTSGVAYFMKRDKAPGMHFCPKAWKERESLARWMAASNGGCKGVGNVLNPETMTKVFLGASILHELTHYNAVGKTVVGRNIIDVAYGPKKCLELKNDDSDYILQEETDTQPELTVQRLEMPIWNADTYTWFAMHIYWEEVCGRPIGEPLTDDPFPPITPFADTDEDPAGEVIDY